MHIQLRTKVLMIILFKQNLSNMKPTHINSSFFDPDLNHLIGTSNDFELIEYRK